MNLLFIGYWELADGLTQATVFPHLRILLASEKIKRIIFVTIERGNTKDTDFELLKHPKITYIPLVSKNFPVNLFNKICDFIIFPRKLDQLLETYKINKVIARATSAGVLVQRICRKRKIPFYVESFEPYADFMTESGTWNKWDLRNIFQTRWEEKTKKYSAGLIPVAHNYKSKLIEEGIEGSKIFVVPCSVNLNLFRFNQAERDRVRKTLGIGADVLTGIYVGKFGGTYMEEEAFLLFQKLLRAHPELRIILLSPDPREKIFRLLHKFSLSEASFSITKVSHTEVPAYLSAADFGFSLHCSTKAALYFSPIKNGEYWATGLPIIISENVGDDFRIVKKENVGIVLPSDWSRKPDEYFSRMIDNLVAIKSSGHMRKVAEEYRNVQECINAYTYFDLI